MELALSPIARPGTKLTIWHLLVLFFGSAIVGAILCSFIFTVRGPLPFFESNVAVLVSSIIGVALYHYMAQTRGWPSLMKWFLIRRRMVLVYCFMAPAVIVACLTGLVALAERLFGDLPQISQAAMIPTGVRQLPLAVLTGVIIAPAFEELMFRRVFFVWLRARASFLVSTLLASLIFSLLHENYYSAGLASIFFFGQRFGCGVATTLLAQHFRSLGPGYAFHAGWNLVVMLVSVILPDMN